MFKEKRTFFAGILFGAAIMAVFVQYNFHILGRPEHSVSQKAAMIAKTIENNYIEPVDENELDKKMYSYMVASLGDVYSKYCTVEDMGKLKEDIDGRIVGIGAKVRKNSEGEYPCIPGVYEGSPAEKAGLMANDIIISVDGNDTRNMDIDSVVSLVRGEAGTSVKLGILRDGKEMEYTITREIYDIKYVFGRLDGDIGYIRISEFLGNSSGQFIAVLEELMSQNIKGLVIDLRDNPGGSVEAVVEIADRLLPEGIITYTEDRFGNRKDFISDAQETDLPIAVLVNGNSASASELLAGALQSTGKGVIVGTQTFGKGIVQSYFNLDDGTGVKLTTSKYYTPSDVCIHGVGITPNHVVETEEMTADENDRQYMEAVKILTKD